jgi:acetyl esterase
VLVCPVLDHDLDRPSMLRAAEGYGLTRDAMRWFWDMYVPDPAQRDDPRASPVRAPLEALAAVAPATIVTAGFDPLADEGDEYARLLARAGVAVVHLPHPGAIHGFTSMPGTFSLAGPAIEAMAASLRASLHA